MGEKIYLLNMLWFQPDGGREKYVEYVAAAAPFVHAVGGRIVSAMKPDLVLIGELEPDLVLVVEYPSWEAFQTFFSDPRYQEIAYLREEALRDSLLIRCRKAPVPLP